MEKCGQARQSFMTERITTIFFLLRPSQVNGNIYMFLFWLHKSCWTGSNVTVSWPLRLSLLWKTLHLERQSYIETKPKFHKSCLTHTDEPWVYGVSIFKKFYVWSWWDLTIRGKIRRVQHTQKAHRDIYVPIKWPQPLMKQSKLWYKQWSVYCVHILVLSDWL